MQRYPTLTVRVSVSQKEQFNTKCAEYGRPADILRELVSAFTEGRMTISPNPIKANPMMEKLYNEYRETV